MKDANRHQSPDPNAARPISKPALLMMWLLLAYGVGGSGWGLASCMSSLSYVMAKETNGTVIRTLQLPNGGIRPEVEYEVGGRLFVTRAMCRTSSTSYRIGDQVRVFYKTDDPTSAKLDSFLELWSLPLVLLLSGIVFLLTGLSARRKVITRLNADWCERAEDII